MKFEVRYLNPFTFLRWILTEFKMTLMVILPETPTPPAQKSPQEIVQERLAAHRLELIESVEKKIRWTHTEAMNREVIRELSKLEAVAADVSLRDLSSLQCEDPLDRLDAVGTVHAMIAMTAMQQVHEDLQHMQDSATPPDAEPAPHKPGRRKFRDVH